MHPEQMVVSRYLIQKLLGQLLRGAPAPLVCVGTTSLRTIESLYWLGSKISAGDESLTINQWDPYEQDHDGGISPAGSLKAILHWMDEKKVNQVVAETRLMIAPGYQFRFVDGLITNFHQPNSTLLLLVAAFAGEQWRKIYDYALQNGFRFLSYGDGSLLWRQPSPQSKIA